MREKIKNLPVIGKLAKDFGNWRRKMTGRREFDQLFRKNRKYMEKNSELKDSLKGQSVFILATGPSIKNQNLKGLAGHTSISVSNFFVHPDFKLINPKFHLFAASHDPITGEQYWSWLEDAEKHFPKNLSVFVSIDGAIEHILNIFKGRNVYHYMASDKKINPNKDLDMTKISPRIQGVTHLAMYYAMYMGAKKIYLLGCDHDRILHVGTSIHFYEQQQHAMVRKGYSEWARDGMQERFKANYELWQKYKEIKEYADKRDIEIYNCTPGSLLDVFPRRELEEVLKENGSKISSS